MQSFVHFSEESEYSEGEFDLSNHHDNIASGIKNIQKIYEVSLTEARQTVETAYVDYLNKLPKILENYQNLYKSIRTHTNFINSAPVTQLTFTLLKCLHGSGQGTAKILTNSNSLVLSYAAPKHNLQENSVKTLNFSICVKQNVAENFELNLFEKISQFSAEQIAFCQSLTVFHNLKNDGLDFCVCVKVEMSKSDKLCIIKLKSRGILGIIRKLRIDSQGINIQKEFKSSCCECRIV